MVGKIKRAGRTAYPTPVIQFNHTYRSDGTENKLHYLLPTCRPYGTGRLFELAGYILGMGEVLRSS